MCVVVLPAAPLCRTEDTWYQGVVRKHNMQSGTFQVYFAVDDSLTDVQPNVHM